VMDPTQIQRALNRLFVEQGQRIVFLNDPEGELEEVLPSLSLDGVTMLRLDQVGAFVVKVRLERQDPTGRYLLYAPVEGPAPEDDWPPAIRLYNHSFRVDRAAGGDDWTWRRSARATPCTTSAPATGASSSPPPVTAGAGRSASRSTRTWSSSRDGRS